VAATVVWAQENPAPAPAAPAATAAPGQPGPFGGMRGANPNMPNLDDLTTVLGLSDEQKQKLTEIRDAAVKTAGDLREANKEKIQAIMDAYRSGDPAAMDKARQDIAELAATVQSLGAKVLDDAQAILTDEQKVKLHEYVAAAVVKALSTQITLTEDQVAKIKSAVADLAQDAKLPLAELRAKLQDRFQTLLTDEQRATLKDLRASTSRPFGTSRPFATSRPNRTRATSKPAWQPAANPPAPAPGEPAPGGSAAPIAPTPTE
jgi:Spy/CpxP family protein refolding chaperone